ncbi:probable beta-D-xylosidase 6 [Diospyros lotus]|uniref:probable beta-D-xylosidase 6 n=1 Tax=Diospyros lotus TaxID=55363 RepID=UPI0022594784|nr:probable beta-D-xylosidase 6 [Diospyros lotus]
MSERTFLILFFAIGILSLSGFTISTEDPPPNITSYTPQLQFACKPPYNSYQFCNTSLAVAARATSLISLLALPEKIGLLIENAASVPRLGIPAYQWWSESLHGVGGSGPGVSFNGIIPAATSFPQVIVTGASFNRSLWYKIASAIGVEGRAFFNVGQAGLTFWAPNVNIFRDPRWGRGQETTGEDPLVAAAYAIEFVKGFQGEDRRRGRTSGGERRELQQRAGEGRSDDIGLMASACCKHYTAYDLEKWGIYDRYNFDAMVTIQDMEDTYQPPFESCVEQGGASCLMCSYNSVNGVPTCAQKNFFQKAREEWGFNGYITSDCGAVAFIYEHHHFTKTPEDAVAVAFKAGLDMECGPYTTMFGPLAVEQGKLQVEDIDRALFNLLSVQIRLGLFDGNPKNIKHGNLGPSDVCTAEHRALALEAARQGTVLLKNHNNFLPLDRNRVSSLAIIGPMAMSHALGGDYAGQPCNPTSVFDGFQSYANKISYAIGCLDGVPCKTRAGFAEAVSLAREADIVIVVTGLDTSQEAEELDRYSLLMPGYQKDLVTTIASASKRPLVLLVTGGGPIDLAFAEKDSRIASILWIGYPGGEAGGNAVAEIIFGDFNPGGRLPITWYPESITKIPMTDMNMRPNLSRNYPGRTYRFYTGEKIYEFGHGLSYTNFTYKLLSAPNKLGILPGFIKAAAPRRIKALQQTNGELDYIYVDELEYCDSLIFNLQASVMNSGDVDGSHVVMLFSRGPKSSEMEGAPEKQLIWFDRIHTIARRSTEISVTINPCEHFSFADVHGRRTLPLGNYTLILWDLELTISINI